MIMTKEDIEKKIEEIKLAISKKDYEIEYYEPNNIREHTAPDGTVFLMIYGDDAGCGGDFGGNSINIAGEEFYCSFDEDSSLESSYFNKIYKLAKTEDFNADDYIDEIKDLIYSIDGFFSPYQTDTEQQVYLYNLINGTDYEGFYMDETDTMIDKDDFCPISPDYYDTIVYNGNSYYLITNSDNLQENETYAVSVEAKPNAYGCYDMVIFTLDNGKVIDISESDKQYDSTNDKIRKLF